MPDQYKTTSHYELGGRKVSQTQAIDGQTGWLQVDGQVRDLPKEAVSEMRRQKYAEDLDRLGFLGDKGIEVTALGEAKVGGRAAVGVLVKSKEQRDVKLHFDRESGRLVKREHTVFDSGTGKDVVQKWCSATTRKRTGCHITRPSRHAGWEEVRGREGRRGRILRQAGQEGVRQTVSQGMWPQR